MNGTHPFFTDWQKKACGHHWNILAKWWGQQGHLERKRTSGHLWVHQEWYLWGEWAALGKSNLLRGWLEHILTLNIPNCKWSAISGCHHRSSSSAPSHSPDKTNRPNCACCQHWTRTKHCMCLWKDGNHLLSYGLCQADPKEWIHLWQPPISSLYGWVWVFLFLDFTYKWAFVFLWLISLSRIPSGFLFVVARICCGRISLFFMGE